MKLYWMKSSEAWPDDAWTETDLTCFDEDKPGQANDTLWETYIGTVHQVEAGPGGGLWQWSVTAAFRGPQFPAPTSGREISLRDAGRYVVECYERMLRFYDKHRSGT